MKGTTKRIISVILMVLLSVPLCSAFADDVEPVKLALSAAAQSVRAGQMFRVNVRLEFDDGFAAATGGINVIKWKLKFDQNVLEPVDPITLKVISFDGNGIPSNGSLYRFGDIGLETGFETTANEAGNGIIMLYGSTKAEGDIYTPGDFVQLAFRPKIDLEITDTRTVAVELAEAGVSVNNKEIKLDVSGDVLNMAVTPFFTVPNLSAYKQNTTLTVEGRSGIKDANRTITVDILKNGEVIDSKSATLGSALYSMDFELDEARYPAGLYNLKFTSGNGTVTRVLEVVAKDAEIPPEIINPTPPDDPDPTKPDPTKPDPTNPDPTNPDPTKPDDKPGNNGGTGSGGTGGNGGGGSGLGGSQIPSNTNPITSEPSAETTPGGSVKYPSDIAGHWAAEYIKYVYDNKLMNGYEDGSFAPEGNITRAEFSAVMARFLNIEGNADAAAGFADVEGHWAKSYIGALTAAKVVGGVSDTEFEPDAEITREQIAVILSRAFGLTADTQSGVFTDEAEISDWARSGVYAVYAAGYMQGNDSGSFSPLSEATRAEVATVISRIHSQKK